MPGRPSSRRSGAKATVSLALRGKPRIRVSERQRIRRLAAENGYAPNTVMAHLLTQLRAGYEVDGNLRASLVPVAAQPP